MLNPQDFIICLLHIFNLLNENSGSATGSIYQEKSP